VSQTAAAGSGAEGTENGGIGQAVGGGNEACRGVGIWASSYFGYRSCIAFLKSSQLVGSVRTSCRYSKLRT
jgi:hypothetical protein